MFTLDLNPDIVLRGDLLNNVCDFNFVTRVVLTDAGKDIVGFVDLGPGDCPPLGDVGGDIFYHVGRFIQIDRAETQL